MKIVHFFSIRYICNMIILVSILFPAISFSDNILDEKYVPFLFTESELEGFRLNYQRNMHDWPGARQSWLSVEDKLNDLWIEVFLFDSIQEAIQGMDRYSQIFAGIYRFGPLNSILIGDMSWVGSSTVIFVRNNIGARVVLALPPEKWIIPETIAFQLLDKIEKNLSLEILAIEQNVKNIQISETIYDNILKNCIESDFMSGFSLVSNGDSKWLVDSDNFIMGRRREYKNEKGIFIGIDIANTISEYEAQSAAAIRTSYIRTAEELGEKPPVFSMNELSSIDSLIANWEKIRDTAESLNIINNRYTLSGISVFNEYVVHIYEFSTGEVDTKLFKNIAYNISQQITFLVTSAVTDEDTAAEPPQAFTLYRNTPNPFNPSTVIGYDLYRPGLVLLRVFDLLGREVAILDEGEKIAGRHEAVWDGNDASGSPVSSGVYFYRLESGGQAETGKMTLVR